MSCQAGPDGTCQFGPSYAQLGCRVALQGTEAKDGQLVTDLVDPRGVLAGEEVALGDEQGDQDGSPGSYPVVLGDSGLGAVNGFDGSFEVDPGVRQVQLDGDASVHGADAENAAQLGQQRDEPGVDRGGVRFSP